MGAVCCAVLDVSTTQLARTARSKQTNQPTTKPADNKTRKECFVKQNTGASAFPWQGAPPRCIPGEHTMKNAKPRRTRLVAVRFTPDEYAQLEDHAHAAGVELSAYVRSILVNAEVPRRARGKSPDAELLGKTLIALNRIGGNINQIARQANLTGDLTAYGKALEDRALLVAAAAQVTEALK